MSDPTEDESAAQRVKRAVQLLNRTIFDAGTIGLDVTLTEVPKSINKHRNKLYNVTIVRKEIL